MFNRSHWQRHTKISLGLVMQNQSMVLYPRCLRCKTSDVPLDNADHDNLDKFSVMLGNQKQCQPRLLVRYSPSNGRNSIFTVVSLYGLAHQTRLWSIDKLVQSLFPKGLKLVPESVRVWSETAMRSRSNIWAIITSFDKSSASF